MKFFGFRIVSTILQIFKSLFCPPPFIVFSFGVATKLMQDFKTEIGSRTRRRAGTLAFKRCVYW